MAIAGGALVLFRQLNLPPVLGYLLAGIIIGPYTLPNPLVENLDIIRLLADLGLVLLLFSIGLELGWQHIRGIGAAVTMIALLEFTIMFALGYQVALLLGWGHVEGVFLGACISISSSAILMKMLRDTGRLMETQGRVIVGILVVEDLIVVMMLTVLTGVATTGSADPAQVGLLVGKLAIFVLAALGFGVLLAPRLVHFVSRFKSNEVLLITGLALCFGLALAGQMLGLSAAAGAFLIGAVLGDSSHADELNEVMSPVRDMFAAIFFVSIGMLMNFRLLQDYWVAALAVSGVFIVGKIAADTVGTLLAGYGGRNAVRVGLGMPQLGEFSLAMAKVGSDYGVVGSFFYPVIIVVTGITALVYPTLFRSADPLANFLERRSPRLLKQYVASLSMSLSTLTAAFTLRSLRARRIQRSAKLILLNLVIIIVLVGIGTGILGYVENVAAFANIEKSLLGLVVGGSVLALCAPPGVAIWRSLRGLSDEIAASLLPGGWSRSQDKGRLNAGVLLRDSILILLLAVQAIWCIPLLVRLLALGSVSTPVPILILLALVIGVALAAFQIHRALEDAFGHALLGSPFEPRPQDSNQGNEQESGQAETTPVEPGETEAGDSAPPGPESEAGRAQARTDSPGD